MLNFSYTLPKEENNGRHDGEVVESTQKHVFKDTTRDVLVNELQKLMGRYDVDIKISLKTPK